MLKVAIVGTAAVLRIRTRERLEVDPGAWRKSGRFATSIPRAYKRYAEMLDNKPDQVSDFKARW